MDNPEYRRLHNMHKRHNQLMEEISIRGRSLRSILFNEIDRFIADEWCVQFRPMDEILKEYRELASDRPS